MTPEARIFLRLLATEQGGRKSPLLPGVLRGVMMFDPSRGYDFRATLDTPMAPGEGRELDVRFLCPEEAVLRLTAGAPFVLWDGHPIGEGEILESFI